MKQILNKYPKSFMIFNIVSWVILVLLATIVVDGGNFLHLAILCFLSAMSIFLISSLFGFWTYFLVWSVTSGRKANKVSLKTATDYTYKTAFNGHFKSVFVNSQGNVMFYSDKRQGFFIEFIDADHVIVTDDQYEEHFMRIEHLNNFLKGLK